MIRPTAAALSIAATMTALAGCVIEEGHLAADAAASDSGAEVDSTISDTGADAVDSMISDTGTDAVDSTISDTGTDAADSTIGDTGADAADSTIGDTAIDAADSSAADSATGDGTADSADAPAETGACSPTCVGGWICVGGACVAPTAPPSCATGGDGRSNCGPSGNDSCCASPLVTGVTTATFSRSYDGVSGTKCFAADCSDPSNKAQISSFRLDKYEVTVGRFRQFVNAVRAGWTPSAGSGKHVHLNAGSGLAAEGGGTYEPGWDASWTSATTFPTAQAPWDSNLNCKSSWAPPAATWTPSAGTNERKPINCTNWYEAEAFCIWDGGFLPSEAEWNFAASGGTDQRIYAWGPTVPGADAKLAVYACYFGTDCGLSSLAPVGSVPAGDGKFLQSDLAGNVWEWSVDNYEAWYSSKSCVDCAFLGASASRVLRGGGYSSGTDAIDLLAGRRLSNAPTARDVTIGVRCARTP
jgi:formylglycine-generating enzyme required for sulfatase activity